MAPARPVRKSPGMTKFYWDFVNQTTALLAPPGSYQVKMTAGGRATTVPWRLLIDPRVAADGVTAADLRAQYAHNVRVRELTGAVQRLQARPRGGGARLSRRAVSPAATPATGQQHP